MAKTKQEKLEAKAEREYYRKHKSQIKKTPGDRIFDVINYTIFALFTLICISPSIICLSIRSRIIIWCREA